MSNPDFTFVHTVQDVVEKLPLTVEQKDALDQVWHMLAERDRHLEDFLNQQVRRIGTANELGDGTGHTSTTYTALLPALEATIQKARKRSKLLVQLATIGRFQNPGAGWVSFSVRLLDPETGAQLVGDNEVIRHPFDGAQDQHQLCAAGDLEIEGVEAGVYRAQVRVRVNAAPTSWVSSANGTNTLTVAESM